MILTDIICYYRADNIGRPINAILDFSLTGTFMSILNLNTQTSCGRVLQQPWTPTVAGVDVTDEQQV